MIGAPLRVALTSLGCKVNFAEMADLAGQLAASGCDVVPDDQPADIRVLNSCTVTLQADASTRQRLRRLRRADPGAHLILTGCSVDGNPGGYRTSGPDGVDALFSNAEKPRIATYISALAGARREPVVPAGLPMNTGPTARSRAFIKVQDGCDHRCTYCVVWRARGRSVSVAEHDVIGNAREAVARGHQEIVLTGVDIGSWGRGTGDSLAHLCQRLLAEVPEARFRISSLNANDFTPALTALNAHPRLCSHWHIPLQSGSDSVLKAMHRGYRRRQFLRVVEDLRTLDPFTEITTDIMVGFPGETADDHRDTLSLIETAAFLDAHVFRHSPRPDTPAARSSEPVDGPTARRRSAEVIRAATLAGRARRERMVGEEPEVVWDRITPGAARGIASTWHTVVVSPAPGAIHGRRDRVRITGVEGDVLRAEMVQ